jgi:hypothetical protein
MIHKTLVWCDGVSRHHARRDELALITLSYGVIHLRMRVDDRLRRLSRALAQAACTLHDKRAATPTRHNDPPSIPIGHDDDPIL